jgi:O-antigen/teichoic acid export membrane protein
VKANDRQRPPSAEIADESGAGPPLAAGGAPAVMPLGAAMTRLAGVQFFAALTALVTGPLQARALGPEGRGELAAIAVPLTLAPLLVNLGLGVYLARMAARGESLGRLVGSIGAVLVGVGVALAFLSAPLADVLAGGRDTVYVFLRIGFGLMPLSLLSVLLLSLNQGLERWRSIIRHRLVVPATSMPVIVVLYVTNHLTLTAAATLFVFVGQLATLPLLGALRLVRRLRVDLRLIGEGIRFGAPAWLALVAYQGNLNLDQLLMIRLVDSHELGLYAVAVTLAYFSMIITGPLQTVILPRSAREDRELPVRAFRVTLWTIFISSVVVAALTPVLLRLLFGSAFSDAAPMVWVLLIAGVPLAGGMVLSVALSAAGRPKRPATGELVALAVTIPGILLLVPVLGGIGAALVSLLAYSVNLAVQLLAARRTFEGTYTTYFAPRTEDVRWLIDITRSQLASLKMRLAR